MDSFEWNKVFASVIAGALVIMVISTVSESIFHKEHAEKPAFTIEVAEADAGADEAAAEEGPSLAVLLQTADPAKGERQFAKCKACHTVDQGGKNGTGPNLYGIVGRAIGGHEGFKYSSAVASHGGEWTYELLDHWLASPKNTIPGNSMSFAGIGKADQRADLIAFLRQHADSPVALPAVEEAPAEEAPAEQAPAEEAATEVTGS